MEGVQVVIDLEREEGTEGCGAPASNHSRSNGRASIIAPPLPVRARTTFLEEDLVELDPAQFQSKRQRLATDAPINIDLIIPDSPRTSGIRASALTNPSGPSSSHVTTNGAGQKDSKKAPKTTRQPDLIVLNDDGWEAPSAAAPVVNNGNQGGTGRKGGHCKRRDEGRSDSDVEILSGSPAPVADGPQQGRPKRKGAVRVEPAGAFAQPSADETRGRLAVLHNAAAAAVVSKPAVPGPSGAGVQGIRATAAHPQGATTKRPGGGRQSRVRAPAKPRPVPIAAALRNIMAGVMGLNPGLAGGGAFSGFGPFPAAPVFPGVGRTVNAKATRDAFAALVGSKLAALRQSDDEYRTVTALFKQSDQGQVVAVHKVLNGPARLAAFKEEASALARVRRPGANVQQCWHGTSAQALVSILKTGFTASRTVNGKAYGNGLYMAPGHAAATSRGYCQPDEAGVLHMFLLKVLLGSVEVGRSGMDLPSNPEKFDSAADNPRSPGMFIMWTPYLYSRILLEYVVSFH